MTTISLNYKDLPISERIQLVGDIWDSIAEETAVSIHLTPENRAEFHRRLATHQTNPSSSISWEEVRATLFQGKG